MLGLRFSRLVHAAIASGALASSGCVDRSFTFDDPGPGPDTDGDTEGDTDGPRPMPGPNQPGPPLLVRGDFFGTQTLKLTFTESIAPVEGVDPNQFRLSLAFSYTYNGYYQPYYESTTYIEPGQWNGEYVCGEYCYEYCYYDVCYERCFDYCYQAPGPDVQFTNILNDGDDANGVVLTLNDAIRTELCQRVSDYERSGFTGGLYIHYSPTAIGVTDTGSESLQPIAQHWVGQYYNYYSRPGDLVELSAFMPIPCPS